ncbi:MAG: hypothetical protein FADNKDHG_01111 [Holosporales bacterium]
MNILLLFSFSFLLGTFETFATQYKNFVFDIPRGKVIITESVDMSLKELGEDRSDFISVNNVVKKLESIHFDNPVNYQIISFSGSGMNDDTFNELSPFLLSKFSGEKGKFILNFSENNISDESVEALYTLLKMENVHFVNLCGNPRSSLKWIKKIAISLNEIALTKNENVINLTKKLVFIHPKYLWAAKNRVKIYKSLEKEFLPENWYDNHIEYYKLINKDVFSKKTSLKELGCSDLEDDGIK